MDFCLVLQTSSLSPLHLIIRIRFRLTGPWRRAKMIGLMIDLEIRRKLKVAWMVNSNVGSRSVSWYRHPEASIIILKKILLLNLPDGQIRRWVTDIGIQQRRQDISITNVMPAALIFCFWIPLVMVVKLQNMYLVDLWLVHSYLNLLDRMM